MASGPTSSRSRIEPPGARKIVLVSRSGYHARHGGLLLYLLSKRIHLFCAVGKQCEKWQSAMDELCVGPFGRSAWHVETTSHPGESLESVLAFARDWSTEGPTQVEVIEV